ncbi:hypothetical protein LDENG_00232750 [Lucifuga dentata]|nr:hypothetical protein LDENG_00232750 [Lucifuga dentata]
MHLGSLLELQESSALRTSQNRASVPGLDPARSLPLTRRGSSRRLCPLRGASLWAWLLLSALMVPGAWSFLSEEEEELLVELHNHYRGQVSPRASAMLPLKWDASLKVLAEGYAAKCHWSHNPELDETGENLFAGTGPLDLRVTLEKWFLEHLDYDYHNNSCHEEKMCGHYTQMVWADTHRVGCAFHLCNTMEGLDWERVSFLVCNYYPAGNYEGEKPYEEGDWCSRCPENLQKCENNLCVADTEDEDEEDDGTVIPPPATSDPFIKPDTAESTTSTPSTTSTLSTTSTTSTTSTRTARTTAASSREENSPRPVTLHPVLFTTQGEEEQEEKENEERDKEEKRKEEEEEEEERDKAGRDRIRMNGCSPLSPAVLLVCLTGILILRL